MRSDPITQMMPVCAFDFKDNYPKINEITNQIKKNLKFICHATDIIRVGMLCD